MKMNEEQPMLAKITKGDDCKYRFWQEDSYVEFDWVIKSGLEVRLAVETSHEVIYVATIKGSSAKEFLRCFEIVKGEL